jgi:hypothetical protein
MARLFVPFEPHVGLAASDGRENSREVPLKLVEYFRNLLIFVSLALIDHFIQVILHFKHLLIVPALLFIFSTIFGELAEQ